MLWICPICNRTFRYTKQAHSCEIFLPKYHLKKVSADLQNLYQNIISKIKPFGGFSIFANKSEILCSKTSSFLGIRVLKSKLQLIFYLDHVDPEPSVVKYTDVSKNRVIHQVDYDNHSFRLEKEYFQSSPLTPYHTTSFIFHLRRKI